MADFEPTIDEKKLTSWKLLDDFRQRLAKIQARTVKPEVRPGGPERLLVEENYFSLILFGLFNPVIKTMRGLCFAGHLKNTTDTSTPFSPPSGLAQRLFQEPPAKSKFLAVAAAHSLVKLQENAHWYHFHAVRSRRASL